MKEKFKGIAIGIVIGALSASGIALAKTATEQIEVVYNNIKVYKDNVLCELKDSNGSVVEPFIYNGTTYMPVRGTANLAGMDVSWDGETQSVFLWDEVPADGTYLLEVCPPYSSSFCSLYLQSEGSSFRMGGTKYSNAFSLDDTGVYSPEIFFNLNSKYSSIEFTIGHIDGGDDGNVDVNFFVDGKLVETITVVSGELPKKASIPVKYGLQLKVGVEGGGWSDIGVGNITVR